MIQRFYENLVLNNLEFVLLAFVIYVLSFLFLILFDWKEFWNMDKSMRSQLFIYFCIPVVNTILCGIVIKGWIEYKLAQDDLE